MWHGKLLDKAQIDRVEKRLGIVPSNRQYDIGNSIGR